MFFFKIVTSRIAVLMALAAFLAIATSAAAEQKTFEREYTYRASDIDSKVTSRAIALEQVKRLLLEELGTYLIAETEAKNFQLTRDTITALTAGFVQTEVVAEKWDGMTYVLKARITADPRDVAKRLAEVRANDQKSRELEETNRKVDEALKKIKQLQDELATGKRGEGRQNEYVKAVDELKWKEWIDKGASFMSAERYDDALKAFAKAAEINPSDPWAAINMGWVLNSLGDHHQALRELNRAEALDPRNPWIYVNRSASYNFLGNYRQGLLDADKAASLDGNIAWAFVQRGWSSIGLGNFDQALADLNRAAVLEPKNAAVYRMRAWAHFGLNNKRQTVADLDKSLELEPNSSWTRWNRAAYFALSGEKDKALAELALAFRINSKLKERSRTDKSFQSLWSDSDFKKLVGD